MSDTNDQDFPRACWTVKEWQRQVPISTSTLYALWRQGKGPRKKKLLGKVLITEPGDQYMAREGS